MRNRKGLLGVVAVLAIAGLGLWNSEETVNADPIASSVFSTGQKALAGAPQGVYLGAGVKSNYFTIDSTVATASGTNAAKLVAAGGSANINNSAIQISKAGVKQSWGSIWSKDQSFDLSKKETASMWIYASAEGSSSASSGDGMAFVVQNGGTNVYSGPGESMGVWGVPDSLFTQTNPASSAIPSSWALEFDTFSNGSIPTQPTYSDDDFFEILPKTKPTWDFTGQNPSSFDVKGDTPGSQTAMANTHIASNYPGDSQTYLGTSVLAKGKKVMALGSTQDWTGDFYYYSMRHLGLLDEGAPGTSGNLSDQRWHHITVDYTPPTTTGGKGSMTYTYNDKDPDTGQSVDSTDYATVPIDLSKFSLASGQTKVRWGFTGSTGDATENNYVIFDQLPGQAQTEASAKMNYHNDSTGSDMDVADGDSVPGGSKVTLTYTFGRTDGDEDWNKVNANLKIPKDLDITGGTITYPDASYQDSNGNKVDISKMTSSSTDQSQSLSVPLASGGLTLSGTQHATITLTGTVKDVATDKTGVAEAAQTSYFSGSNATSSAKTPNFTITSKVNPQLAIDTFKDQGTLKINYGSKDTAHVYGTVVPDNKTLNGVIPGNIVIHPTINGVEQNSVTMGDIPMPGTTSPYYFDYSIISKKDEDNVDETTKSNSGDSADLQPGDNKVSFYATYGSGDDKVTSTTVNAIVVAGTVGFGHTSGDITFEPTTLTGNDSVMIERDNDWSLDVDDSQTPGSPWKVTAKTDGMYTTDTAVSTKLDGDLIYRDADGNETTLNDSAAPIVATGESSADGTDSSTNIAKDWTNQSGILLKVNSGAVQGVYKGDITWAFENTAATQ